MSFEFKALAALQRAGEAVLITIAETRGSTPRERGAQMLVTSLGMLGSIGGGTLEWQAMAEAQSMLARQQNFSRKNFVLGPDLGQCCGGSVVLELQRFEATQVQALQVALEPTTPRRRLYLFGAGHVGRALVLVLAQSNFDIVWVDPRPRAFPSAQPQNVKPDNRVDALTALDAMAPNSFALVMSHSHELDFAIVDKALRQSAIVGLGLIGSATKKGRFLSRLRQAGHSEERLSDMICPIGGSGISSKEPYAVALSTAHQFLALDEKLQLSQTSDMSKAKSASW